MIVVATSIEGVPLEAVWLQLTDALPALVVAGAGITNGIVPACVVVPLSTIKLRVSDAPLTVSVQSTCTWLPVAPLI